MIRMLHSLVLLICSCPLTGHLTSSIIVNGVSAMEKKNVISTHSTPYIKSIHTSLTKLTTPFIYMEGVVSAAAIYNQLIIFSP